MKNKSEVVRRPKLARHLIAMLGSSVFFVAQLQAATISYPVSLSTGWTLAGNSLTTPLDVKASFGAQTAVQTVWKWDAAAGKWAFYAPALDATGKLAEYAASKGYSVLTTVAQGEGFWVNATAPVSLGTQSGVGYALTAANLVPSWNLVATGDELSPGAFSTSIGNVTTLWAWDGASGSWYFHAPALAADNTLGTYIQGKGYKDFGALSLGKGLGFWVNYAGAAPSFANACLVDASAPLGTGGVYKYQQCYVNPPSGYACTLAAMGPVATTYHAQNGYPSGSTATLAFSAQASCPTGVIPFDMGAWYVTTLAGGGGSAAVLDRLGYADGPGATALFNAPKGIAADGKNLYVADTDNHRIRKIEIATGQVTTFAGSGVVGSTDGVGVAAKFYNPTGIASDGTNVYVQNGLGEIRKIAIASQLVSTLATVSANNPALATDGVNVYVLSAATVLKVAIATGQVTTLAGSGKQGSVDGIGTQASFYSPAGIATDGTYVYVADDAVFKIRKIAIATGEVSTLVAKDAPVGGLYVEGAYLYVASFRTQKIHKVLLATGVVSTVAGANVTFTDGFGRGAGNTVPGQVAQFYQPWSIVGVGKNLYVIDTSRSSRVRKLAP